MWVFGYGSLMWDGWEVAYECRHRVLADLPDHMRVFNKASIRNWGSKRYPGPTLNLAKAPGRTCQGVAFEFAQGMTGAVLAELKRREGGFTLTTVVVRLAGGDEVEAVVPIYTGKNLIEAKPVDKLAQMVTKAAGTSGMCIAYVENIANTMSDLGIVDPAIEELLQAIKGTKGEP